MEAVPETQVVGTNLCQASKHDFPALATHHRKMFEEIWENSGRHLETEKADKIQNSYTLKLEVEFEQGICKAWVTEEKERIISSGAITIVSLVPNPFDLSWNVAYLHSMYTEKPHRNKKCAQGIISAIISYCKSNGIRRIILNSSDEGQPVYQKFGFRSTPDTMRLFIE